MTESFFRKVRRSLAEPRPFCSARWLCEARSAAPRTEDSSCETSLPLMKTLKDYPTRGALAPGATPLPTLVIKGDTFAYNRIPVIDMTIKLCPSTNPITATYTTELHVCKQQYTSFTCFSRYLKHTNRYVYETSQTPRL